MKNTSFLFFLVIFISVSCKNEKIQLYQSDSFSVMSDQVIQGGFKATAKSPKELQSNYQVISKKGIEANKHWYLSKDLSRFPEFKSEFNILNSLYNLSLEEAENLITKDSVFDTGAKWGGVWTRDLSYASMLSLSTTHPEIVKNGLIRKVRDNRIIQDTGTGGAWPVSTDRMIWSAAAFHLYKVTGDKEWLEYIYKVIKNSLEDDIKVALTTDYSVKGESSFIDWREQSYPRWMQPADIYNSENLGTVVAEYQAFSVLGQISQILGYDGNKYLDYANKIRTSFQNKFWNPENSTFYSYYYGRNFLNTVDKTEALGASNAVIWSLVDDDVSKKTIANFPVVKWGTPVFYPQIPNMHPYHNNGIWPFVQAYWNLAAKKVKNAKAVEFGMAGLWRSGALFVTNYENYVAQTGDWEQTDVEAMNSHNMLWSIAGMLSNYYSIIFGIEYNVNSLYFNPFLPNESYMGEYELNNFKYRNAILNIKLKGYGDQIISFKIDGELTDPYIDSNLEGEHDIEIIMNNSIDTQSKLNLVENKFSPETPNVKLKAEELIWDVVDNVNKYEVYRNGQLLVETKDTQVKIDLDGKYSSYQVKSIGNNGCASFLSEPIEVFGKSIEVGLSQIKNKSTSWSDYLLLSQIENNDLRFDVNVSDAGKYALLFYYSNGNGPINTENKCAIRSLFANDDYIGAIVLPQRGEDSWDQYGWSNSLLLNLKKGNVNFKLSYESFNQNMNIEVNSARLKKIILHKID
jgi:hypothetical protein